MSDYYDREAFGNVVSEHEVDDPDSGGVDRLIFHIMDLEALVRWLALTYSYMEYDPNDAEDEGTLVQNEPIWTVYDERGTHLPAAEKLQATWNKVMHDAP